MNALVNDVFSNSVAQRVGWALIHFVWQGAAVALLLALVLQCLRRRSPPIRWALSCAALGLMVVLPVVPACLVSVDAGAAGAGWVASPAGGPILLSQAELPDLGAPEFSAVGASTWPSEDQVGEAAMPSRVPWRDRLVTFVEPSLSWIVLAWLVGVLALSVWYLGGWWQLARTKRSGTRPVEGAVAEAFGRLTGQLGVSRPVRLLESARVAVPVVVGWLRPVILFPASVLSGFTPEQLQAVLAHELAHVRRYDCLVRVIQAAVETLLFYHPAVWWVSGRIRQESEHCCDELAVEVCGDRRSYARALARVAELGRRKPQVAPAASGGNLLDRIRSVISAEGERKTASSRWLAGISTCAVVLVLAAGPYVRARVATYLGESATQASEEQRAAEDVLYGGKPLGYWIGILKQEGSDARRKFKPEAVPALVAALKHEESDVHRAAFDVFRSLPPDHTDASVPMLLEALQDNVSRFRAACLLVYTSRENTQVMQRTIPVLVEGLKDPSALMRGECALALGSIGEEARAAVPALIGALGDQRESVRRRVAISLRRIGPGAKAAVPALREALNDNDKSVRVAAATALASVSPEEAAVVKDAVRVLVEALQDQTTHTRNAAAVAEALGKMGRGAEEAVAVLRSRFEGEEVEARLMIAWALARITAPDSRGEDEVVSFLLKTLKSNKESVYYRALAAQGLGEFGPRARKAIPELARRLASRENHVVRGAAAEALGKIGPPAASTVPLLREALRDSHGIVRFRAAVALARIGVESEETARDVRSVLRDALQAQVGPNYGGIVRLIGWTGGDNLEGSEQAHVRAEAAKALQKAGKGTGLGGSAQGARFGPVIERVVGEFLEAAADGDDEAALKLFPNPPSGRIETQTGLFRELAELNPDWRLEVDRVLCASQAALLIDGREVRVDTEGKERGHLCFTLRQQDGSWHITDIDLEDPEGLEGEIERFRQRHPDAELWRPEREALGSEAAKATGTRIMFRFEIFEETDGETQLRHSPSLVVFDGQQGTLFIGTHVPYKAFLPGGESEYLHEPAGLTIDITPSLTHVPSGSPAGTIVARVKHRLSWMGDYDEVTESVVMQAQEWQSTVLLQDGESKEIPVSPAYSEAPNYIIKITAHILQESEAAPIAPGVRPEESARSAESADPDVSTFGPVFERVVNDDSVGENMLIDFDTGDLFARHEEIQGLPERLEWFRRTGIDALCDADAPVSGLVGMDMVVHPFSAEAGMWDKMTARNLKEQEFWTFARPGFPVYTSAAGDLPATFAFRTREGGMGILQIVGFTEDPKGVKIRYKMVQDGGVGESATSGPRSAAESRKSPPARAGLAGHPLSSKPATYGLAIDGWEGFYGSNGRRVVSLVITDGKSGPHGVTNTLFIGPRWSGSVKSNRAGSQPISCDANQKTIEIGGDSYSLADGRVFAIRSSGADPMVAQLRTQLEACSTVEDVKEFVSTSEEIRTFLHPSAAWSFGPVIERGGRGGGGGQEPSAATGPQILVEMKVTEVTEEGKKVVASPSILVADGKMGYVSITEGFDYVTGAVYRDTGEPYVQTGETGSTIRLTATLQPAALDAGVRTIELTMLFKQRRVSGYLEEGRSPIFDTREWQSTVVLRDGEPKTIASAATDTGGPRYEVRVTAKLLDPHEVESKRGPALNELLNGESVENLLRLLWLNGDHTTGIEFLSDAKRRRMPSTGVSGVAAIRSAGRDYVAVVARRFQDERMRNEVPLGSKVAFLFDQEGNLLAKFGGKTGRDVGGYQDVAFTTLGTEDRWFVRVSNWLRNEEFKHRTDMYLVQPGFPLALRIHKHSPKLAYTGTPEQATAWSGFPYRSCLSPGGLAWEAKGIGRDGREHLLLIGWDPEARLFRGASRIVHEGKPIYEIDRRASQAFRPTDIGQVSAQTQAKGMPE